LAVARLCVIVRGGRLVVLCFGGGRSKQAPVVAKAKGLAITTLERVEPNNVHIKVRLSGAVGIAAYVDAHIEEVGHELCLKVLGRLIKHPCVTDVISKAGIASWTSTYGTFSAAGTPEMRTVGAVLDTMGLRLADVRKVASQPALVAINPSCQPAAGTWKK
jgi:DNA-binding phage protein